MCQGDKKYRPHSDACNSRGYLERCLKKLTCKTKKQPGRLTVYEISVKLLWYRLACAIRPSWFARAEVCPVKFASVSILSTMYFFAWPQFLDKSAQSSQSKKERKRTNWPKDPDYRRSAWGRVLPLHEPWDCCYYQIRSLRGTQRRTLFLVSETCFKQDRSLECWCWIWG